MPDPNSLPERARRTEPAFFPVSAGKLFVLSCFSFGAYQLYWFSANWSREWRRSRGGARPIWRALLAPLTGYALFRRIKNFGLAAGVPTSLSPGLLALGYFALVVIAALPGVGRPVLLPLTCLPLLPVRSATERINLRMAPECERNARFSTANWLLVALGALAWSWILIDASS